MFRFIYIHFFLVIFLPSIQFAFVCDLLHVLSAYTACAMPNDRKKRRRRKKGKKGKKRKKRKKERRKKAREKNTNRKGKRMKKT